MAGEMSYSLEPAQNITTNAVVGWVAGPDRRGTLTLVWSCVITIFACTWTVLHLNVPGRHESSWRRALRKVKWMAINVLFPEFILSKAVCDLRLALDELRGFDEKMREEKPITWTVVYGDLFGPVRDHDWSWKIEYPRRATLLYRVLGLKPPLSPIDSKTRNHAEHRHDTQSSSPPDRSVHISPEISDVDSRAEERFSADAGLQRPAYGLTEDPANDNKASADNEVQSGLRSNLQDDAEEAREAGQKRDDARNRRIGAMAKPERRRTVSTEPSLQEQPSGFGDPESRLHRVRKTQLWTVVHSYYAQMGGLLYPDDWGTLHGKPAYHALVASKLTSRYDWTPLLTGVKHPLERLFLGEKDIQDKSKADWLVKGIAMLQITSLILDLTVRGTTGLPITQIEIATLAFAIMAIVTYLANWWKPKDVSQPTILPAMFHGTTDHNAFDGTQPFMLRLWSPAKAAKRAQHKPDFERVPNDLVWMEGDTPLMFVLMAMSSLVFGGLHCLAWKFEFPTRTELICWRVASLISAILPVVTLVINLTLNYFSTKFVELQFVSTLLPKLRPLEQLPAEWWQLMKTPVFESWDTDARRALIAAAGGRRGWETELSSEAVENAQGGKEFRQEVSIPHGYNILSLFVGTVIPCWHSALGANCETPVDLRREWFHIGEQIKIGIGGHDETLEFIRKYEGFLRRKLAIPSTVLANTTCVDTLLRVYDETIEFANRMDALQRTCNCASPLLAIFSGILYTAARVTIVILLFTCLRAVPAGVYHNTPWTRFLPSFS